MPMGSGQMPHMPNQGIAGKKPGDTNKMPMDGSRPNGMNPNSDGTSMGGMPDMPGMDSIPDYV